MLLLCTKEVNFANNNGNYPEINGVTMGSSLGPVFASIFTVEPETSVRPIFGRSLFEWKSYVADRYRYVEVTIMIDIWNKLNGFHELIQFTYKLEKIES